VACACCLCSAFVLKCVPLALHKSDIVSAFRYMRTQLSCIMSVLLRPDLHMSSMMTLSCSLRGLMCCTTCSGNQRLQLDFCRKFLRSANQPGRRWGMSVCASWRGERLVPANMCTHWWAILNESGSSPCGLLKLLIIAMVFCVPCLGYRCVIPFPPHPLGPYVIGSGKFLG